MGLFQMVAGLLFLLSVLSIGGIFAYKKMVQSEIDDLKSELATLESQLDQQEIQSLVTFDRKLSSARDLLASHVSVSSFFKMLEANTVAPLYYTSFKYNAPANQDVSVEIEGKAESYRIISEQEKAFLKNPNTVSLEFKDLNSDSSKRESSFIMNGVFKRSVVEFKPSEDAAVVEVKTKAEVSTTTVNSTATTTSNATTSSSKKGNI
jgi:hypothetical protein